MYACEERGGGGVWCGNTHYNTSMVKPTSIYGYFTKCVIVSAVFLFQPHERQNFTGKIPSICSRAHYSNIVPNMIMLNIHVRLNCAIQCGFSGRGLVPRLESSDQGVGYYRRHLGHVHSAQCSHD